MNGSVKEESDFEDSLCKVCNSHYSSGADKAAHLEGEPHRKKKAVHDFIINELADSVPDQDSLLYIRYFRAGVPYIGSQFVVELEVNNQQDRIWACRACNSAGKTLYTADAHIYSREHIHNSFKLITDDEADDVTYFDRLMKELEDVAEEHIANVEFKFIIDCIVNNGPACPIAYRYPVSAESLAKQLMVTEDVKLPIKTESIHDDHDIVHCDICFETYITRTDPRSTAKNWENHLTTSKHQEMVLFKTVFGQVARESVTGLPASVSSDVSKQFVLNNTDLVTYGPLMGLKNYLTLFASDAVCSLCCCVIKNDQIRQHFSCESHCLRYLRCSSLSPFATTAFMPLDVVRSELNEVTGAWSDGFSADGYYKANVSLPSVLKVICRPETRKIQAAEIKKLNSAKGIAHICETCHCVVPQSEATWEAHVVSEEHFDSAIEHQLCERDEKSFINEKYDLPKATRKKGAQWNDRDKICDVQNYCEYGFDLIFYDTTIFKYICTCCYKEFSEDSKDLLVQHARSLAHIRAAICVLNPEMAVILSDAKNGTQVKIIIMDYLKHNKSCCLPQKLRKFDPLTAFNLNMTFQVPRLLLRLAQNDFYNRSGFIKENKLNVSDSGEIFIPNSDDRILLTTALMKTNLVLTKMDPKTATFWCLDCHLGFSTLLTDAKAIWTEHLLTEVHWKRLIMIEQQHLPLMCLQDEPSAYQLADVDQEGRESWIWSPLANAYIFALNNKLVLNDVSYRELRSKVNNFFCLLCCETFEISALTTHVRTLKHLVYYMHKYYSGDLPVLQDLMASNKDDVFVARSEIRDFIAEKLRCTDNKNSKISHYKGQDEACRFPNIQIAIDHENVPALVKRAKLMGVINSLPSVNDISDASIHKVEKLTISEVNVKTEVFLHMVMDKILHPSVKDPRPRAAEEPRQLPPQRIILGPVISKVILTPHGKPIAIDVPVSMAPIPVPRPIICPVPPPSMVPIKIEPEAAPMDISDDESPNRRYRSRSRTFSPPKYSKSRRRSSPTPPPSRRYDARGRSRSRSPVDRRFRESPVRGSDRGRFVEDRNESRRFKEEPDRSPDNRRREIDHRRNGSPQRYYLSPPPRNDDTRGYFQNESALGRRYEETRSDSGRPISGHRDMKPELIPPRGPPPGVDVNVYERNLRHNIVPSNGVTVFEPIDLTKPPQFYNPPPYLNMPPPNMMPPGQNMPGMFPPSIFTGMPPPMNLHMMPPPIQTMEPAPPMDTATRVMLAKMELYERDLNNIQTKHELIEYFKTQGHDPIPKEDPVLYFNDILKTKNNIIGGDLTCQVLCFNNADLETYFCLMCQYWTTVNDMFTHLKSPAHRMNYLHKSYKVYHAKVQITQHEEDKLRLLEEYAQKVSKVEGVKLCNTRMRCLMNPHAIYRIWPDIDQFIDNSWKIVDEEEPMDVKPRVEVKSETVSKPPERERERERDRDSSRYRERDPKDRREREKVDVAAVRNRSYSPARRDERDRRDERIRTRSPRDDKRRSDRSDRDRSDRDRDSRSKRDSSPKRSSTPIWEKQTEIFNDSIERLAVRPSLNVDDLDKQRNEQLLQQLRNKINSNGRSTEDNGFLSDWNDSFREPSRPEKSVETRLTAPEKRLMEREAEKKKRDDFQRKVSALVLIRQEALENKGVDKDTVDRICKETGVVPDEIFEEDMLEQAAKTIGGNSAYMLTALAHHYNNPLQPAPKVLQEQVEGRNPHAATLLANMGIDKAHIANLLKKVSMAKMAQKNGPELQNELFGTDDNKKRGRRGGVKLKMKQKIEEYRAKMIAAGIDPGADFEPPETEMEGEEGFYGGGGRVSANQDFPPQITEDYMGPRGQKGVYRPKPSNRGRPSAQSRELPPLNSQYSGFLYDEPHPSAHRLESHGYAGPARRGAPEQRGRGSRAPRYDQRDYGGGQPEFNAVPPSYQRSQQDPRAPSYEYQGPQPGGSQPGYDYNAEGAGSGYTGFFGNTIAQERSYFPPSGAPKPPPPDVKQPRAFDEDVIGDWDSAEQALSMLFN